MDSTKLSAKVTLTLNEDALYDIFDSLGSDGLYELMSDILPYGDMRSVLVSVLESLDEEDADYYSRYPEEQELFEGSPEEFFYLAELGKVL